MIGCGTDVSLSEMTAVTTDRGGRVNTQRQYGVQFTSRNGPFQCAQLSQVFMSCKQEN